MTPIGTKDVFTCTKCGKHICTIVAEDGVPCTMIICRVTPKCSGLMVSRQGQGVETLTPTWEWRKPKPEVLPFLPPAVQNYVAAGGLSLYKLDQRKYNEQPTADPILEAAQEAVEATVRNMEEG